ncbi:MAG TPA: prepilin-type N-terminal cleavage/methylation domain-containing protein [Terriglobales bacterium]
MRCKFRSSSRGFTLMEMMISLFVGVLVLGVAVQLFTKSLDATWMVSQRAELQQDARASFNIVTKDVSLANSGLSDTPFYSGIALASGAAINPTYGCDYTGACHLGAANNGSVLYPSPGGINSLYGVIPGWRKGPTISAAAGATDVITMIYLDTNFLLNQYLVRFDDINGNSVTFKMPAPVPNPVPQAVNDTGVGLQRGDLVLFQRGTLGAIAEVTAAVGAGGGPYTVSFANTSPLGFNQNSATSGNLNTTVIQNAANVGVYLPASTTATRIWVVTYYIDNTKPTPTLMRLVNGRLPVPVTENVADLRFTYNTYDSSGNLLNNTGDGGLTAAPAIMPSAIRTINLDHLTIRSQSRGTKGYQAIDLHSAISARNMGFVNRYQ